MCTKIRCVVGNVWRKVPDRRPLYDSSKQLAQDLLETA